jgi:hypothetical protein
MLHVWKTEIRTQVICYLLYNFCYTAFGNTVSLHKLNYVTVKHLAKRFCVNANSTNLQNRIIVYASLNTDVSTREAMRAYRGREGETSHILDYGKNVGVSGQF